MFCLNYYFWTNPYEIFMHLLIPLGQIFSRNIFFLHLNFIPVAQQSPEKMDFMSCLFVILGLAFLFTGIGMKLRKKDNKDDSINKHVEYYIIFIFPLLTPIPEKPLSKRK